VLHEDQVADRNGTRSILHDEATFLMCHTSWDPPLRFRSGGG